MNPLVETSLHGTWTFIPENGSPAKIQVPGGGWLKQGFDCEAGTYETTITIPDSSRPQSVWLELGAVNHIAEYSLCGLEEDVFVKIHKEVTAFTPQCVDLTPHVLPGKSYHLRIFVRAYQDGHPVAPHWAEWNECIARGIFRDAYIRVYPHVFISDVFVKPSVKDNSLKCEVQVTNASDHDRLVMISGKLQSCCDHSFSYPEIRKTAMLVKSGETSTVSVGPLGWQAGRDSYWWPNVPYREGYRTVLHGVEFTLSDIVHAATTDTTCLEGDSLTAGMIHEQECWHESDRVPASEKSHEPEAIPIHKTETRFGFRELRQEGPYFELNGERVNFRGDNLQVANYDRIDHGGKGDAIDTLPGFLPPSNTNPGWPKAVDNFLRLNYNVQREHMGPWSPYMLDVCDEMGLMLIGESACRWNGFDMEDGRGYHEIKCLQDIVKRDRNHPSIVRWSSKNEAQCQDPSYHEELYDTIKALDDTRPVFEDYLYVPGGVQEPLKVLSLLLAKPDFTWMDHYFTYDEKNEPTFSAIHYNDVILPMKERPFGVTEANWMRSSTPAGLSWFATTVALGRARDASDMRPYVLVSSWASSIPGVKTTDLLTEENRHPVHGEDNLPEPWTHADIQLLQKAYHPLLAMDFDFWWRNRKCDMFGHFPVCSPAMQAGKSVEREVTVFNDEFSGDDMELRWEVREGSNANWIWEKGSVPLSIRSGYAAKVKVSFVASRFNTFMFLTLRVYKDGIERFTDNLTCFEIVAGEDFRSEFNGKERLFQ